MHPTQSEASDASFLTWSSFLGASQMGNYSRQLVQMPELWRFSELLRIPGACQRTADNQQAPFSTRGSPKGVNHLSPSVISQLKSCKWPLKALPLSSPFLRCLSPMPRVLGTFQKWVTLSVAALGSRLS